MSLEQYKFNLINGIICGVLENIDFNYHVVLPDKLLKSTYAPEYIRASTLIDGVDISQDHDLLLPSQDKINVKARNRDRAYEKFLLPIVIKSGNIINKLNCTMAYICGLSLGLMGSAFAVYMCDMLFDNSFLFAMQNKFFDENLLEEEFEKQGYELDSSLGIPHIRNPVDFGAKSNIDKNTIIIYYKQRVYIRYDPIVSHITPANTRTIQFREGYEYGKEHRDARWNYKIYY